MSRRHACIGRGSAAATGPKRLTFGKAPVVLNALRLHTLARLHFTFYALLEIAVTVWILGVESQAHLLLLLVIIASFFQYPPWEIGFKYASVSVAGALLLGLEIGLRGKPGFAPMPAEVAGRMPLMFLSNVLVFLVSWNG